MMLPFLALAVQTATPAQQCGLIAASGDPLAFGIAATPTGAVLVPTQGSAWPSASLLVSRTVSGASETIAVGAGGEQLAIVLGAMSDGIRDATLFQVVEGKAAIPLATGYCIEDEAKDSSGARAAAKADVNAPVFDRARWTDKCVAITSQGTRVTIDIDFPNTPNAVNFRSSLWKPGSVSVFTKDEAPQKLAKGIRLTPRPFAPRQGASGPSGEMMDYLLENMQPPAFVRLLELRNLASDVASSARAICGTRSIIRRATFTSSERL